MKRKIILGTVLVLSLVTVAFVAAVAPTFAGPETSNLTSHSNMGKVILDLPPPGGAIASHPTNLEINPADWTSPDTFFGSAGHDLLTVSMWNSTLNMYVPVAYITDNANPELAAFIKTAWAGVPWTENIIVVGEKELEVWVDMGRCTFGHAILPETGRCFYGHAGWDVASGALIANLTKAVDIKFGDKFPAWKPLNFTLPAMTMVFRGIGDDYKVEKGERVSVLPKPPYSGYAVTQYGWERPAFVEYTIRTWGISANYEVGVMRHHWTLTYIPPA